MTIKLATIKPHLTTTQVSKWITRQISTLERVSLQQKAIDGYIALWVEAAQGTNNSNLMYKVEAPSSGSTVFLAGWTNQFTNKSAFWGEYDPTANTKTLYRYTRTGSHDVAGNILGIPNSTQADLAILDSSFSNGLDMVRVNRSTGAIVSQIASGNLTGTYSSGGLGAFIYEGSTPTAIAYFYRPAISAYVGIALRFNSTLSAISQGAYFYMNLGGNNSTIPYTCVYVPGATNPLFWGGYHGGGTRIIGAISSGMGGSAAAYYSEYGSGTTLALAAHSSTTDLWSAGWSSISAGTAGYISKHNANSLTTAPTTRVLYKSTVSTYFQAMAYDETNDFVYVGGYTSNETGLNNGVGLLAKYVASTMTLVWQREFDVPGYETYIWNVKLDNEKNLILGGEMNTQGFIIKYSASGPTNSFTIIPDHQTKDEFTLTIREGTCTAASPTTTASTISYNTFAAPSISFGSTSTYTKEATAPTYTTDRKYI